MRQSEEQGPAYGTRAGGRRGIGRQLVLFEMVGSQASSRAKRSVVAAPG